MGYALLAILLFPYIGVINGIDIQPTFVVLSSICIILVLNNLRINVNHAIVTFLILLIIYIRFVFEVNHLSVRYVLIYTFSVITPYIIYILLDNNIINVDKRVLFISISICILVGAIQIYFPKFLTGLVSRSQDAVDLLLESNRGVRSLAAEPAGFGKILIQINILYIVANLLSALNNNNNKVFPIYRTLYISLFIIACSVLLSQSAYIIGFHLLIILIYLIIFRLNYILFLLLALIVVLMIAISKINSEYRAIIIFQSLLNNPEYIMSQGAFRRLINVPISIRNSLYYGILGAGNNPEVVKSTIWTPIFGDYNYFIRNRNLGGYIEFYLKFGILSVPIYLVYFHILYRISRVKLYIQGNIYRVGLLISLSLFTISFQSGSPVDPITWFMILAPYIKLQQYEYLIQ